MSGRWRWTLVALAALLLVVVAVVYVAVATSRVVDIVDHASLMMSEETLREQRRSGTWVELFHRSGWDGGRAATLWALVGMLPGVLAYPLLWRLLRPLPDRGILIAHAFGLLATAFFAWLPITLGAIDYSASAIVLGLALLTAISVAAVARHWTEYVQWLRARWRLVVGAEALFLLAYGAYALYCTINPDFWHNSTPGGEVQFDLSAYTATARSLAMPPYDPWFSGGYLNYYYWGYFVMSMPLRLSGLAPAVGYNLAMALLFALTVASVSAVAYNIAGLAFANIRDRARRRWRDTAAVAATAATVYLATSGNLEWVRQGWHLLAGWMQWSEPPSSRFYWIQSRKAVPDLEAFEPSWLTPWLSWSGPATSAHIAEFPFFTYLAGSLHAHWMAMPFAMLTVVLGLALLAGATARLPASEYLRSRRVWVTAGLLGLSLGSLVAIHSWDVPPYALLALGFIAGAAWIAPGRRRTRLALAAGLTLAVVAVGTLAFLPFHIAYEPPTAGLTASRWRTPIQNWLLIHAVLSLPATLLLTALLRAPVRAVYARWRYGTPLPVPARRLLVGVVLPGALLTVYCSAAGYVTAGCLMIGLTLTLWALGAALTAADYAERRSDLAALAMLALGLAVSIGVDFVTVADDRADRLNTLFRYYLTAWLMFSLAGGYGILRWWTAWDSKGRIPRLPARRLALAALALAAGAGLVYPALATLQHSWWRAADTPPTLDGSAYMDDAILRLRAICTAQRVIHSIMDDRATGDFQRALQGYPDAYVSLKGDAGAIRWLQENVSGTPVVLEAVGRRFCWNARYAVYTGLPTALGWPGHLKLYRNQEDLILERAADVARLYNTADPEQAFSLIREYDIAYIVVSVIERALYEEKGLVKFEAMTRDGILELAHDRDGALIYRVAGYED